MIIFYVVEMLFDVMVSGALTFDTELNHEQVKNLDGEDFEVRSVGDGRVAAVSTGSGFTETFVFEENRVQVEWWGFDHVDLGELEFYMTQMERKLPDEFSESDISSVKFHLNSPIQVRYEDEFSVDEDGIFHFTVEDVRLSVTEVDERDNAIELHYAEVDVDSVADVKEKAREVSRILGSEFEFIQVL